MKSDEKHNTFVFFTKFANSLIIVKIMTTNVSEYESERQRDLIEARQLTAELNLLIVELRECNGTCEKFNELYNRSIQISDRIETLTSKHC